MAEETKAPQTTTTETTEIVATDNGGAITTTQPEPAAPVYKLTIADNVVEKIAARASARVDGIIAMKGNFLSTIQDTFGGSSMTKGVSADLLDDSSARVELDIILEYGKSAVDVFEQVKDIVVGDVKSMTGLEVAELDVNVVDVMTRDEYNKKKGDHKKEEEEAAAAKAEETPAE